MNKYVLLACAMVTIAGCAKKASHVAQEQSSVGKEIGTRTVSRAAKEIGVVRTAAAVPAPVTPVSDEHRDATQEQAAITIAHTEVQELDLDIDNDTEADSQESSPAESEHASVATQKDVA